jgi:hypothetical protein
MIEQAHHDLPAPAVDDDGGLGVVWAVSLGLVALATLMSVVAPW